LDSVAICTQLLFCRVPYNNNSVPSKISSMSLPSSCCFCSRTILEVPQKVESRPVFEFLCGELDLKLFNNHEDSSKKSFDLDEMGMCWECFPLYNDALKLHNVIEITKTELGKVVEQLKKTISSAVGQDVDAIDIDDEEEEEEEEKPSTSVPSRKTRLQSRLNELRRSESEASSSVRVKILHPSSGNLRL
jgi:hypothetical protein